MRATFIKGLSVLTVCRQEGVGLGVIPATSSVIQYEREEYQEGPHSYSENQPKFGTTW